MKRLKTTLTNVIFITISILILTSYNNSDNKSYGIRTVVIDAGHGGKDPGCKGYRIQEKDVALAIALRLGKYIKTYCPDVKVIFTRHDDTFVELYQRAEIANKNKADLFISIHCNANPSTTAYGVETYVMGLHKSQANLNVAKKENSSILLEKDYKNKYEGFDPNSAESYIIFSLYQNAYLDQSLSLASKIEKKFSHDGRTDRGVKQAGFLVLWKTYMPSMLIETGFLSNPEEEVFLSSENGQSTIAYSIFKAFKEYKAEAEGSKSVSSSIPRKSGQELQVENNPKPDSSTKAEGSSKPKVQGYPNPNPSPNGEGSSKPKVQGYPNPNPSPNGEGSSKPKVQGYPNPNPSPNGEGSSKPKVQGYPNPNPSPNGEGSSKPKVQGYPKPDSSTNGEGSSKPKVQVYPNPNPSPNGEGSSKPKVQGYPKPDSSTNGEGSSKPKVQGYPNPNPSPNGEGSSKPKVQGYPNPNPSPNGEGSSKPKVQGYPNPNPSPNGEGSSKPKVQGANNEKLKINKTDSIEKLKVKNEKLKIKLTDSTKLSNKEGKDKSKNIKTDKSDEADKTGNVVFKVQFYTSPVKKASDSKDFKGLEGVDNYFENKTYKYTVGNEKNLDDARNIQKQVREKGFKDAFIIALYKGKKITIAEATKILNSKL